MASHSFSVASREADIPNVTGRDLTMAGPYDTADELNVWAGIEVGDVGVWDAVSQWQKSVGIYWFSKCSGRTTSSTTTSLGWKVLNDGLSGYIDETASWICHSCWISAALTLFSYFIYCHIIVRMKWNLFVISENISFFAGFRPLTIARIEWCTTRMCLVAKFHHI